MVMKSKKILWICLGVLDVGIVGFLFVVHILMLANVVGKDPEYIQTFAAGDGLLPYLAGHLSVYGFAFVIPLFVILAANIVGLVLYMKKSLKKSAVTVNDLSDAEKEALKKELLKDLENDNK